MIITQKGKRKEREGGGEGKLLNFEVFLNKIFLIIIFQCFVTEYVAKLCEH